MTFCTNCGQNIGEGANFCGHCGHRMAPSSPARAPSSPVRAPPSPPRAPVGYPVAQTVVAQVVVNPNIQQAERELKEALSLVHNALKELQGAMGANTVDLFARRGGLLGAMVNAKQFTGLRQAQQNCMMAERKIQTAERLVPGLPLMANGERLRSGSLLGLMVFDGLAGDLYYRQKIQRNIQEANKMKMGIEYALHWLRSQASAVQAAPAVAIAAQQVAPSPPPAPVVVAPVAAPVAAAPVVAVAVTVAAANPNIPAAKHELREALQLVQRAIRELEGAKGANTVDLVARRRGVLSAMADAKQFSGLRKAKEYCENADRKVMHAERLVPKLPLLANGIPLRSGSLVGMLVFDGLAGDLYYRQKIQRNIQEAEKMKMGIEYGIHWLNSQATAVPA